MNAGNNWQPADPDVARLRDRMAAGQAMILKRIEVLEEEGRKRWELETARAAEHRTRAWQFALAILTGVVLPLVVIGVLAALHLSGK